MTLFTPTEDELRRHLSDRASRYEDKVVTTSEIAVEETEEDTVKFTVQDKSTSFSESALGQILNKIQIPTLFFQRCPSNLKKLNFDYFNKAYPSDYFFRLDHGIDAGHVRAVLSSRYSVVDDKELFEIISGAIRDRDDVCYRTFSSDDHISRLELDFIDTAGEMNGRHYVAGLCITNSETGHSSVWVEPVVHTPSCSFYNRRVLKSQGVDCRIVHRGKFIGDRVCSMVEKSKEVAQVGLVQLEEAFQTSISRDHALRSVRSIDSLPSRFQAILEEEWAEQQDIVKAEVAGRIIEFAQGLPLFQRIQVEQAAGQIVGLFSNYKTRFADLAREITS